MVVVCQENVNKPSENLDNSEPASILEKFERREFLKKSPKQLLNNLRFSSSTSLDDQFLFSALKHEQKHCVKYQSGSIVPRRLDTAKEILKNSETRQSPCESLSTSSDASDSQSKHCDDVEDSDDNDEFDLLADLNLNNELNRFSDLTIIEKSQALQQSMSLSLANNSNLLSNLSSDIDDDEDQVDDVDDEDDFSSRRKTIIFARKLNNEDINKEIVDKKEEIEKESSSKPILLGTSSISSANSLSIAAEVASLSSVTSNYSQFDFNHSRFSPSPPPQQTPTKTNNSIATFFMSTFGGHKKHSFQTTPQQQQQQQQQQQPKPSTQASNSTFDLITNKLLNFKHSTKSSQPPKSKSGLLHSSNSGSPSTSLSSGDNLSVKSNHSINNLSSCSSDLKVPCSVLIFENRPSNLPAKSQQEALKHKMEYEKMVEAAKRKEQKEKQITMKKYEQQMRKEDFMANSLRIWNNQILTNWAELKNAKRTRQLWWHGLPPSIRGRVWRLAIGNELNLTKESYYFYEKKARQKLENLSNEQLDTSLNSSSSNERSHESSVELIKLDVSRTFPHLCFFQRDGPYHEALHNVLGAYACYNTKIGYVQGMSFLTAILLLNMEAPDAFVCLANLLNTKFLNVCFCMDQAKMNRYFRVHQILFEHNIPKLYEHFEEHKVKPDLYLIEWIFTLFSKSLPLDVMSRVWDVFFRDHEEFLFRTALGILNLYKETLIQMDFIHIVQFLTKLPENINSTHLFKSIEQMSPNIDDNYLTFQHLINSSLGISSSASTSSHN